MAITRAIRWVGTALASWAVLSWGNVAYAQERRLCGGTSNPDVLEIIDTFRTASNVLVAIAFALAVLFIVLGGIKYITAHGDRNAIAEAKQQLIYSFIGLGIVVMASILRGVVSYILGC